MLTQTEVKAYLNRLGINDIQSPNLSFLSEIHSAHVRTISWQTIDIVAGCPMPIDLHTAVGLMLSERSGYCLHLNGAFSCLLRSLGYQVSWHRAGVQPLGQEPRINSFHLGLTVTMQDERWIVDVGLGDMPYMPLPIRTGVYRQGPYEYKVVPSSVAEDGWRIEHSPGISFVGADYAPQEVVHLDEFLPKHEFYSRSPESPWHNLFLVRQRHANGGNELRGCIWNRRDGAVIHKEELLTKSQWLDALAEVFQERLVNYSNHDRDELWKKVYRYHEEWKKQQQKAEPGRCRDEET